MISSRRLESDDALSSDVLSKMLSFKEWMLEVVRVVAAPYVVEVTVVPVVAGAMVVFTIGVVIIVVNTVGFTAVLVLERINSVDAVDGLGVFVAFEIQTPPTRIYSLELQARQPLALLL